MYKCKINIIGGKVYRIKEDKNSKIDGSDKMCRSHNFTVPKKEDFLLQSKLYPQDHPKQSLDAVESEILLVD